jgi:iron complex transport system substrate-binding protein
VSDGFPVTIENKLGRAEIPRRPERVVALGSTDADIAVALGVTPLGVPKYVYGDGRDTPWLAARIGAADVVELDAEQPSLEQIASLRPDVILASSFYSVDAVYDAPLRHRARRHLRGRHHDRHVADADAAGGPRAGP